MTAAQRCHHHLSNLRLDGAVDVPALAEEIDAACQAEARRATRASPLTSATSEPENAPHAKGLVEHVGASACDVQYSGEHCVAV